MHPSIADAAVVPSPDEEAGEVLKAFSVVRNPFAVEEVLTFAVARLSPHKKICRVEFVEQLGKRVVVLAREAEVCPGNEASVARSI